MCGIVGVFGTDEAVYYTLLALHALQHRGQEGIGVAWESNGKILSEKRLGFVSEFVKKFPNIKSKIAVGHIRYSTTGKAEPINLQPIVINGLTLKVAICHNGNIVNFFSLRKALEENGSVFTTDMDTEVIAHLMTSAKGDFMSKLIFALSRIKGAYSLVIMIPDALYAVRDPIGFRPLCIGRIKNAYVVASETCALDIIGAEPIREIEPGEIVKISKDGVESFKMEQDGSPERVHECIFELIYFSRPDSTVFGFDVWNVRKELGRQLAREQPVPGADIVIPVPDSGLFAAMGFSEESKIPFEYGLVRNHYIGRTFIEPSSAERASEIRIKLNPVRGVVRGKKIVLVDDSIVRGTTSKRIVSMLREAGAKEIHMRISSPPIRFPCYYGIDTPSRGELIASAHSVGEIRTFIGCDTIGYLSVEGMLTAVEKVKNQTAKNRKVEKMNENESKIDGKYERTNFCTACFTGRYPVLPENVEFIEQLRLFRDIL